jgi:dihydrolipoamide dehydrogenase
MAFKVIMPKAGMAMETGKIVQWLKSEGDVVQAGEPLLEIETDKVNMEVEAMDSGILLKILNGPGEAIPVVRTIGYIGQEGEEFEDIIDTALDDFAQADTKSKDNDIDSYDIVVVGGGPAGYIAAIKASKLGAKTALVEKSVVGGTCLNRGCIPTKTYLKTAEIIEHIRHASNRGVVIADDMLSVDMPKAVSEKNKVVSKLTGGVAALLKSNGVTLLYGEAKIYPDKTISLGDTKICADKVIFAGGSKVAKLNISGMDSKRVLTSNEILDIEQVPKNLVIIGGGVIGVEIATIFRSFGSEVTIIELMGHVVPMMDKDVSKELRKALELQGINIYTSTKLEKIEESGDSLLVYTDKQEPIEAEYALLSIGRVPDLSAVEHIEIEKQGGRIKVDDNMRSSIGWIFAPGDINGRSMLAHAAFKMGEIAAQNATGQDKKVDLNCVPSCVYTMPEIGAVGMTEDKARKTHDISVGMFPFGANGRALASGESNGFVKVIIDKRFGEVLGVHIIGPAAAETINEASSLMASEITAYEIAEIVHGHPTFSEAFMEAAADSLGDCLHLPPKKTSN